MTAPLIMIGAGHAHLVAIRDWIRQGYQPPPGSVLVTPEPEAWYSGMMPGLLAGRWQSEQCRVALGPLCRAAGISLQLDSRHKPCNLVELMPRLMEHMEHGH